MKIDVFIFNKKESVFIKYIEILENIRNINNNKFNRELIYSKKYLKAKEKLSNFQCLYEPVMLIDAVYRKDENYYHKVFLEKYYFIEDI